MFLYCILEYYNYIQCNTIQFTDLKLMLYFSSIHVIQLYDAHIIHVSEIDCLVSICLV